ncbi:MAG: CarD family transcriptional regulator [Holosporales bacterium]|jgi:CarD family transcriptional regulator|nr:CarD family transcriptional regulator [Holosporales bacterium]
MAQRKLFEVGSWVVYPAHGVGRLDSIDKFEIEGQTVEFFVISFHKSRLVLKLPVAKALETGLRKIFSKQEMQDALNVLVLKTKKRRLMWSKKAQEYEAKINSGDPIAIAEVVRDLYKEGKEIAQSFSARQIYQNAIERLAREISIVDQIEEEEAVKKVETILHAA